MYFDLSLRYSTFDLA